jgi:hypothetical protein
MFSKMFAVVAGTSAVSHTPAGNWFSEWFNLAMAWPWIEFLSTIAIILLIIERSFIIWAWNNKRRRGEL